jgi:hypothetical protein
MHASYLQGWDSWHPCAKQSCSPVKHQKLTPLACKQCATLAPVHSSGTITGKPLKHLESWWYLSNSSPLLGLQEMLELRKCGEERAGGVDGWACMLACEQWWVAGGRQQMSSFSPATLADSQGRGRSPCPSFSWLPQHQQLSIEVPCWQAYVPYSC